jgi:predicted nucleic acid-binding protein
MVEVCLATPAAAPVLDALATHGDGLTPDLLDAEVFAVLLLRHKRGELDDRRLDEGLRVLLSAALERVPSGALVPHARPLARALSGYDALYAALATTLGCPLLTAGSGLAATAAAHLGLVVLHVPPGST